MSRQRDVLRRVHQNATADRPRFEDLDPSDPHERGRTVHAAALIQGYVQRAREVGQQAQRIAAALSDTVDAEFRMHCRVGGVRDGTLTICVDAAGRVYPLRMKWMMVIRRRLQREAGVAPVRRVAFEQGLDGAPVGCADE